MEKQTTEERKKRDEIVARMKDQGLDFHSRKRGDREKSGKETKLRVGI